ncbi:hypothetical protein ERO13_D10G243800v2 [Gossypium hirsutum]|uniref:Flocculation protein FLO11-like n=1 Tax=Gossypium hirsutum TaxID=3635 RepID=A0A1U8MDA7_GOSHI|nr:uncharacterized protein LOC107935460 [Gossypium hirsutum]KAG4127768.1 hypothetical protein ERO13_D10G243800v2 [Gossypium hirsutum]
MVNSRNGEFVDDRVDRDDDELIGSSDASSSMNGVVDTFSVGSGTTSGQNGEVRNEIGLTERLTDIFVEENNGDLLLQQSDREDRVLQWLQALDMQVIGACRTDERLKPLLKVNVSNGVAEDRLLAHLSQHFEPSEVGMLARCFCIPLVSIRVGKINKQGTCFQPTAARGNLSLTLLPTSDLRLSFVGDDGQTERLFTLSDETQCAAVSVNEIPADSSGRSFLVKLPDGKDFYYWCSERSKLLGVELLSKMKDLIKRKPSIAELTGISESRLGCFATQLHAYLLGSSVNPQASCSSSPSPSTTHDAIVVHNGQSSSATSKSLRSRHSSSQASKVNALYQGSLSPKSSSFKEGLIRNSSFPRSTTRDKLRRRGDNLPLAESLTVALPIINDSSNCNQAGTNNLLDSKSCSLTPNFLESLGKLATPPTPSGVSQVSSVGPPLFSPYYCWCPPGSSTLQCSATSELPASTISSFKLPPLSSMLPTNGSSSSLKPTLPLGLTDVPSLDFPAFLPEPLVRLPLASSQQIPTFTPLICDPIVHIPVIDVCSSGQGYLVSAGPTISSSIPPLHPNLVNPLLPDTTDSVVEKGARETLRLLISGSTHSNPPLIDVLPAVDKKSILVTGSRGLYSGTRDISALASGIATVSFATLSSTSMSDSFTKHPDSKQVGSSDSEGACSSSDAKLLDSERS